ncbi:MAG: RNA repair transcriptional activator RtcR [Victivallales bacterium]|nr:RNA repair transcriptional activator RtcR [Victivallales bacterium]
MNIVISFLGTTLDAKWENKEERWDNWRPSIALVMQPDLHFDQYHILYQDQEEHKKLLKEVVADIKTVSPKTKIIPELINFEDPWNFEEVYSRLYDFFQKMTFQPDIHNYYIHLTTGTHVAQICLFLLTESKHLPGKLIQTRRDEEGNKARSSYSIIDLNLARYDMIARRFAMQRNDDLAFLKSGIETKNQAFNLLIETIERVAIRSQKPMLLTGPTGAGKSHLAKRIYELKKKTNQVTGRFVDANCATLRGDQAMATLFGHKRGAFTGAVKDREGLLKTADGGVLFLDEIGELRLDEQAMLLRAIEEKTFLPLGSDDEETSSFQLICGTNRNLEKEIEEGKFREDLYERINLWDFRLPGLAERREDIEPNIDYELEIISHDIGTHVTFNAEAHKAFMSFAMTHPWRGNFRELNAMLTRLATLAPEGRIDFPTVQAEFERQQRNENTAFVNGMHDLSPLLGDDYKSQYDLFDIMQLSDVLEICRGCATLSEAGRKLFAVSRQAKSNPNDADRLKKYLAHFNLTFQDVKSLH